MKQFIWNIIFFVLGFFLHWYICNTNFPFILFIFFCFEGGMLFCYEKFWVQSNSWFFKTHSWTNLESWYTFVFISLPQFIKSHVSHGHKNLKDFNRWVTTVMEWKLVADIKRCSRLWQGFIVLQSHCSCPGKCIIEGCESVSLIGKPLQGWCRGGCGVVFRKNCFDSNFTAPLMAQGPKPTIC